MPPGGAETYPSVRPSARGDARPTCFLGSRVPLAPPAFLARRDARPTCFLGSRGRSPHLLSWLAGTLAPPAFSARGDARPTWTLGPTLLGNPRALHPSAGS